MDDAVSNGFPFEWIDLNLNLRTPGQHGKQAILQPFDIDSPGLEQPEVLNLFGSEIRLELPELGLHGEGLESQTSDGAPDDSASGNVNQNEHPLFPKTSVVDELDIWCFEPDLLAQDSALPVHTWATFERKSPPDAKPSNLLSEAGARVFDAAVPKTTFSNVPSGAIPQTVAHAALCNLALGRSSVFFQWDGEKQQFVRTLEDAPISGLSPLSSETFIAKIAECGAKFRTLSGLSVTDAHAKHYCSAIVAFRCCIAEILDGLENILTESLSRSRSLLRLQQLLETPRQLLSVLCQLNDALNTEECSTEEDAISVLADKVHMLASAGHPCCEVLQLILSRTSATWLERLSSDLGLSLEDCGSRGDNLAYSQAKLSGMFDGESPDTNRAPSFIDPEDFKIIQETRASMKLLRENGLGDHIRAVGTKQGLLSKSGYSDLESRPQSMGDDPPVVSHEPSLLAWADSSAQEAYIADLDARINQHPSPSTNSSDSWRNVIRNLLHSSSPDSSALDISPGLSHRFKQLRFDPLAEIRSALQAQHEMANRALLFHFFKHLKLRDQLDLQRQFHLLGNGAFVSRLSIALFSEETQSAERKRGTVPTGETMGLRLGTRQGQRWPPASSELRLTLLGLLNETYRSESSAVNEATTNYLSKELPGNLSFSIRELPDEDIEKVVDAGSIFALDFLRLSYQPSSPLDAIFTPSAMQVYDDIFRFLLKLLRLVHVTTKLRERILLARRGKAFGDIKASTSMDDQTARFSSECHVFVSTLFSYIMDIGIQAPWQEFMDAIATIEHALLEPSTNTSFIGTRRSPKASRTSTSRYHNSADEPIATLTTVRALHETCLDKIKTRLFLRSRDAKLRSALEEALAAVLRCNGVLEYLLPRSRDENGHGHGNGNIDAKGDMVSTSNSENDKAATEPVQKRRFLHEVNGFRNATREFVKLIARRVEQAPKPSSFSRTPESWEGDIEALGVLLGRLDQFLIHRGD